jgi:hypothetical protein
MLLNVTVLNFNVPDVIFDLAWLSFQVHICESAAKQTAPAKKQDARVNPMVFVFMCSIEFGFSFSVNIFPGYVTEGQTSIDIGQSKRATITTAPIKAPS